MSTRTHPPERQDPGAFVWFGSLILLALLAAVISAFAVWALLNRTTRPEALSAWGVLGQGQPVLAWADLSERQDLSAGCLVTTGHVIQWKDRSPVANVPLAGANVDMRGSNVIVTGNGYAAICRFADPDAAQAFAQVAVLEGSRLRRKG